MAPDGATQGSRARKSAKSWTQLRTQQIIIPTFQARYAYHFNCGMTIMDGTTTAPYVDLGLAIDERIHA